MGYNPEAVKFQYDFLNDEYEKLPVGLRNAIESGKEIIVLMNPPYVESSDKSGELEKTLISSQMADNQLQRESKQLFNQFIFRLINFSKKIDICQFTNASLFTYPSYQKFRDFIFENKKYVKGFVIDASEFADVKSWPLTFSILKNK